MGKNITNEEFLKKVYSEVGNEYTPLDEYIRSNVNIRFKHNVCNTVFSMSPNHFLKDKRRCAHCFHGNKKSPEQFKKEFYEIAKGEYELCSEYVGSRSEIKVFHKACQRYYYTTPHSFLRGSKCALCYGNLVKTTEEFNKEVLDKGKGRYILLSKYKNNKYNVKMKHLDCGNIYYVTPHDFLSGNRCPHCKESKGEKMVESILEDINVKYIYQKVFDSCGSDNQRMPFDFYIPDFNILIEYDGIQHYKPVKYFGGDYKLKCQMKRDQIKNKFAKDNNIKLVRIPYNRNYSYVYNTIVSFIRKAEVLHPKK